MPGKDNNYALEKMISQAKKALQALRSSLILIKPLVQGFHRSCGASYGSLGKARKPKSTLSTCVLVSGAIPGEIANL